MEEKPATIAEANETPLHMLDFYRAKMPLPVKVGVTLAGALCFISAALMLVAAALTASRAGSFAAGLSYIPEAGLTAILGILISFRKNAIAAFVTLLYGIFNIINIMNIAPLFKVYAWCMLIAGIVGFFCLLIFDSAWRAHRKQNADHFRELAEKPKREAREMLRASREKAAAEKAARDEKKLKDRTDKK